MARLKDHLNTTPFLFGWVIRKIVFWPIFLVRIALIASVFGLWVVAAPRATGLVWSSLVIADKAPDKSRTPKRSLANQHLLDGLNDVHARIRGQQQQPERRWFRFYQHADGDWRSCSSAYTTKCG